MAPVERMDVAQLQPIEVIYICKEENAVLLQTDTDDLGIGKDARAALANMKDTSPAVIYLDTAEYLVIGPGGEEAAEQLNGILKGSVQLCATDEKINLKVLAQYLPVHGKLPEFSQWKAGQELPVLHLENERIKMSKNVEKVLDKSAAF